MGYNILLVFMFFNLFSFFQSKEQYPEMIVKSKLIQRQITKHKKKEKEERNLHCGGSGISAPDKIRGIVIDYSSKESVRLPEARRMFVHIVEDLIEIVRADSEIQPYLVEQPFSYRQAEISLSFNRSQCALENQKDPFIIYVSIVKDKYIYYRTINPITQKMDTFFTEPYEEALKIVQEEDKKK